MDQIINNLVLFADNSPFLLYIIIFIVEFFESFFFLGLFVPGTIFLLVVGFLTALTELNILYAALVVFWSVVMSSYLNYFLGKEKNILNARFLRPIFNSKNYKKAEKFITKYESKSIFLCRFIGIMRAYVPFASANKVGFINFSFYNVLGAFFWGSFFIIFSNFFAMAINITHDNIDKISLSFIFGLFLVALFVFRWRLVKKLKNIIE